MNITQYIKHFILLFIAGTILAGCGEWLNVKPQSEIDEEELFADEGGFEDALIGVYLIANQENLYGTTLSFYEVEMLGQQYQTQSTDYQKALSTYDMENQLLESLRERIWGNMYNAIAHCNNIIEHLEGTGISFSENRYELIYGESLALRALFHFDLLRLYHPSNLSNAGFIGMPYNTKLSSVPAAKKSTTEIIDFVLADLTRALELLDDYDPILPENTSSDAFFANRTTRMNYYAVEALLARVYLYKGDYSNALIHAQKVTESNLFRFIKEEEIIPNKDYVFFSEQIFCLYSLELANNARQYFYKSDLNESNLIYSKSVSKLLLTEVIRNYWFDNPSSASPLIVKYNSITGTDASGHIPVLKLGEMVLIEAECTAYTNTPAQGIEVLNQIRMKRGQPKLVKEGGSWTIEEVMQYIKEEYQREFIGEGQLFYFYKRLNMPQIEKPQGGFFDMNDSKYTLPVPKSEIIYGG